jgi:cystathionine gamma-synthase
MNALFVLHRALLAAFPERKSVQFGFPYVDSLKLQQCYGAGVHFYPRGDAGELDQLRQTATDEQFAAIYTELPTNPLLASPDLLELRNIADAADCPFVVDDTLGSSVNVDVLPIADVAWSSLTKFFSGVGDVIGGVIIVNPDRRFANRIQNSVRREWEDLLWPEDAMILERNSRDFEARVRTINGTAEKLAEFLRTHPRIERVYYPKFESRGEYDAFKKPEGGYGGLLSIDLRNAPQAAPRFYDALRICKGPNLGMNYSLACPFSILAHYHELDFAERCGVSRYLVRVSVGLEPAEDLIERFETALSGM